MITGQCKETGWYRIVFKGTDAYVSNKYLSEIMVEAAEKPEEQETVEETNETGVQEGDWVGGLQISKSASQIIVVAVSGNSATLSMHNKNGDGSWSELLSTSSRIGRNGIGKSAEGDGKTPQGMYGFSFALGLSSKMCKFFYFFGGRVIRPPFFMFN